MREKLGAKMFCYLPYFGPYIAPAREISRMAFLVCLTRCNDIPGDPKTLAIEWLLYLLEKEKGESLQSNSEVPSIPNLNA